MELAGALAEIANETLKDDFRRINPKDATSSDGRRRPRVSRLPTRPSERPKAVTRLASK